jgi:hypothetical protein
VDTILLPWTRYFFRGHCVFKILSPTRSPLSGDLYRTSGDLNVVIRVVRVLCFPSFAQVSTVAFVFDYAKPAVSAMAKSARSAQEVQQSTAAKSSGSTKNSSSTKKSNKEKHRGPICLHLYVRVRGPQTGCCVELCCVVCVALRCIVLCCVAIALYIVSVFYCIVSVCIVHCIYCVHILYILCKSMIPA